MDNKCRKLIRQARGSLSLRDFAKKCGISHTHLDSIEKGYDPRTGKPVQVSVKTLKKISNGSGIPLEQLIGYDLNDLADISSKPAAERTDVEAFALDYMGGQISDLGDRMTAYANSGGGMSAEGLELYQEFKTLILRANGLPENERKAFFDGLRKGYEQYEEEHKKWE